MRDLSELQNYLEFIYNNIDDETERVEMSVDVFEDLRAFFNSAVLMVVPVMITSIYKAVLAKILY